MCRTHFRPFAATRPENLRTFSQNPSTFFPNPTAFRRSSPTLRPLRGTQGENRPFAPSLSRAHHTHSAIVRLLPSPLHPPRQPTHAQRIRSEAPPPFFLHPALHPSHRRPPRNDRGQKWPKAVKTEAQGEAFTHNTLFFKRLSANRREHRRGETFTRNPLAFNRLRPKGEEVKEKNEKRWTRARHAYALGDSRATAGAPRGQGAKKRLSAHRPPEKKL